MLHFVFAKLSHPAQSLALKTKSDSSTSEDGLKDINVVPSYEQASWFDAVNHECLFMVLFPSIKGAQFGNFEFEVLEIFLSQAAAPFKESSRVIQQLFQLLSLSLSLSVPRCLISTSPNARLISSLANTFPLDSECNLPHTYTCALSPTHTHTHTHNALWPIGGRKLSANTPICTIQMCCFLRRFRSDLTRSLLILKNELGAT